MEYICFYNENTRERICIKTSPNYAIGISKGFSFGLNPIIYSGDKLKKSGDLISSLGGVYPSILLTRNLLYRACKLSNNLRPPPKKP